jgi:glycosyltransferase involved in cell wall biosynthesis
LSKIKVVHLVAGGVNGGAGRGAYWLHKSLIRNGIDSVIITNGKNENNDPTIISTSVSKKGKLWSLIVSQLDSIFLLFFPKRITRIFSTGFFGLSYNKNKHFKDADIIHLHWINGLVSASSIKKIKKPIVWSIRDMWPMTGGCHYSLDCEGYKTGCGDCPQLNAPSGFDFTRLIVKKKKKYFSKVKPVGISDWVTDELLKSSVFSDSRPVTINNNVDCSVFYPTNKITAREILGIETNKKIILVGSTNVKDFYKGFPVFLDSLKFIDSKKYTLCVFGKSDKESLERSGFEYIALGYLHEDISLRLAYSAADVFVAPSIQEAFGKTIVESMACKTPVVCFDATGPASIVEHKKNGYKARPFSPEDFASGIEWIVDNSEYEVLCASARDLALTKFDSVVVAEQYVKLYKELLSKDM